MENKVFLGDCRQRLSEIADQSVDLIVTDPPYNTGLTARRSAVRLRNFFSDRYTAAEYHELVDQCAREFYRVLAPDRAVYVFINWRSLGTWLECLGRAGFTLKNVIVWDKVMHGLNLRNYAHTHEFLIFATKGVFRPRNRRGGDGAWKDIWHVRRETTHVEGATTHHETVKPLPVVMRAIEHGSEEGWLVLDPFMGTGTTCVAASLLNRRYLGIESDPDYYRLALGRVAGTHATEVSA